MEFIFVQMDISLRLVKDEHVIFLEHGASFTLQYRYFDILDPR